jgi:hypothetical protein
VQTEQAEDRHDIARQATSMDRYVAKRQMLSQRKEECNKNIRDLGVLPEEAFEKYIGVKSDKVSSCSSNSRTFTDNFFLRPGFNSSLSSSTRSMNL